MHSVEITYKKKRNGAYIALKTLCIAIVYPALRTDCVVLWGLTFDFLHLLIVFV
jgi:hypothetical protein